MMARCLWFQVPTIPISEIKHIVNLDVVTITPVEQVSVMSLLQFSFMSRFVGLVIMYICHLCLR